MVTSVIPFIFSLEHRAIFWTVLSVWLTARRSTLCWPTGILSSLFYGIVFWKTALYLNVFLQLVFVLQSLYGWRHWATRPIERHATRLTRDSRLKVALLTTLAALLLAIPMHFTHDASLALDATTTALSLVANWLLAKQVYENWHLWIAADLLYLVLFATLGLWGSFFLYVVLTLVAIHGFLHWRTTNPNLPHGDV